MRERRDPAATYRYRCCCCRFEFSDPSPGAVACPRCQSVGGHEQTAAVAPRAPGGE